MKTCLMTLGLLCGTLALAASPQTEIQALLDYIGGLNGAVFVRNGEEHSATDAAKHLAMKWKKAEKKVRTAEDFIALCAAKSSMSGKRYLVRFPDGTERFSDELLTEQLTKIRTAEPKGS